MTTDHLITLCVQTIKPGYCHIAPYIMITASLSKQTLKLACLKKFFRIHFLIPKMLKMYYVTRAPDTLDPGLGVVAKRPWMSHPRHK